MKQIKIQQQNFVLLSSGAIYWIEKATLMLADPHLGKIAHFRKNGIAVPRKAEGVFYNKVARIVDQFEIKIQQQNFVLHSSVAIYWIEKATLMMADPHLGKIAHFRKNGIAVPRKAEGVFYNKVARIVDQFEIKRFLFLGDLFHSYQNNEWYMFSSWVKNQKAKIILVEGNHDVIPANKFEKIGITVVKELIEEYFYFSHFPSKKEGYFTFCGHVHPGIKLKGSGLQKLKMPCFFNSTYQMILPAFGAFTGLHILIPKKEDKIYVTTGKEVIEIGEN